MSVDDELDLFSAQRLCIDPAEIAVSGSDEMRPLRKVWALVLTVAVVDYLVAKPTSKKFREAKDWIFYGQAAAANSFDNVAHFLDFDPERLRTAIACRRTEVWADPQKAITILADLRAAGTAVAEEASE
jgi:hypothetical protein